MNKYINFILRAFIGVVFIFSGASKLAFPVAFELSFAEVGISWYIAPFLARILIASEFILGLAVLFNIKTKLALKFIIVILLFFNVYLIYLWVKSGNSADCNCFGEYLKLNPLESIIKNVILLIPAIYLLYKNARFKWRFEKLFVILIVLASLFTSFAINYIEMSQFETINPSNKNYELKTDRLGDFVYQNDTIKLNEGKKIVCFFSLYCKYCKLAAKKITIFRNNLDTDISVYYVLGGENTYVDQFWEETASYRFPYLNVLPDQTKEFFSLSGNSLPSIYFLDNGIVWKKVNYEALRQEDFETFLNLK